MSAEGEQQRRPGAPDDSDGKRRLRAISYPDPYLVTKLPLEGTVNSGVIRLGERMLLGFIHRPYPDGTRVRVVYDEWLFAERLEEDSSGDEGSGPKRAARKGPAKGTAKSGGKSTAKASAKESGTSKAKPDKDDTGTENRPVDDQARMFAAEPPERDRTPFPDDFSDPERKSRGDRIGGEDAWTDTFGEDDRDN